MFKNITWGSLFKSKTFWGAFIALVAEAGKTLFPSNPTVALIIQLLGGLLATLGLVDRTATPNAGK
jgi:hypothetical protein